MYRSAITHGKKPSHRNFLVWHSHRQCSHVTMAISDAAFWQFSSAAVFHFICSTIGLLSDSYASCCMNTSSGHNSMIMMIDFY